MSLQPNNASSIVKTTRESFDNGVTKNVKFRLKQLKNFNKFLVENQEALLQCLCEDVRKEKEEARLEIIVCINHVKYLLDNLKKWVVPEKPRKRWVDLLDGVYVYNEPYGVVLVLGSWNVPLLTLAPVTGAIAAGNCVVIKPSHNCPNFGKMLSTILPKYLDPTCYPVFLGDIEETTKLLEERFDYIYYTGSPKVGRIVHQAANKYLTPTTLELGGKNPTYIDKSADIELAATRIMWGKCYNSGQICIAPDYILCDKNVETEFIKYAKKALTRFYDDDIAKSCPILNELHFKRLQSLMNGLHIIVGGGSDPVENYIEPTIVVDVDHNHPIMQEEIFGPILPIITVDSHEEAVSFIRKGEKPLTLYIFAENAKVRDYIIENTSSGSVAVNDVLMQLVVESLPFGGVGNSGMGRYKSKYSFDLFVNKKSVLIKRFNRVMENINELRYPPYSKKKSDVMAYLLQYRRGPYVSTMFYMICFLIVLVVAVMIFYHFVLRCR